MDGPRRSRIAYSPALDGLRALAVIAVLVYHHDADWVPGGFLGVSMFFTLSGFLITSLLLAEHDESGRIGLRAFWARRIRRLLPASVVALALAGLVTILVVPGSDRAAVAGDVRAAVLNVANWRFIAQDVPYADLDVVVSPVRHYWSLAIEEQFYLLYPVLGALALRRRHLFAASLVSVVAVSLVQQLRIEDFGRVYEGSDTRAAELAVGALFALAHPHLRVTASRVRTRMADIGGVVGIAAFGVLALSMGIDAPGLVAGGLLAVTVIWILCLLGALEGARVRSMLASRPLVEIGLRSYGIYLYHFPLFILLDAERTGLDGPSLLAVRILAVLGVSWASYRLVEAPVRYTWRPRPIVAPVAALTAVAVVVGTTLIPAPVPVDDVQIVAQAPGPTPADAAPAAPTTRPDGAATTETTTSTTPVAPVDATPVDQAGGDTTPAAAKPQLARAPRILMIGDSTSRYLSQGLQQWGASTGLLETTSVNGSGCVVMRGELARHRDGFVNSPQCGDVFSAAISEVERLQPDAVVVVIGSFQLLDWSYRDLEGFHSILEPEIQRRYERALRQRLDALTSLGVPVLWADLPVPDFDIDLFSMENFGAKWPGSGTPTINDPVRHAALEAINEQVMADAPNLSRWAFAASISEPGGTIPSHVRPDGLHLDPDEVVRLAPSIDAAMREAYRGVLRRTRVDAPPNRWNG